MKRSTLVALLIVGVGFASISVAETIYTWTGGAADGDWNNVGNWATGVPVDESSATTGLNGDMVIIFDAATGPTLNLPELNGNNNELLTNATPRIQVNQGVTEIKLRSGWWNRPRAAGSYEVVNVGQGATLNIDTVAGFYFNRGGNEEDATATIQANGTLAILDDQIKLGGGSNADFSMIIESGGRLEGLGFDTTRFYSNTISLEDGAEILFGTGKGDLLTKVQTESYFGSTFLGLDGATLTATDNGNGTITIAAIPEPATLGLIAATVAGLLFIRRRFMI